MRYADHDCRVKALRLHFILNAQMETCVNKCKDRKQTVVVIKKEEKIE
jgi:hypothetical protein